MANARQEAIAIVDSLPNDATWEDIMHQFCLRAAAEDRREEARQRAADAREEAGRPPAEGEEK
jgi:hypothetical protein